MIEQSNKKINIIQAVLMVLKGTMVGLGAIIPGISGGALCLVFGMYKPLINLLTSPIKTLKKDWLRLLLFLIGAAGGFVGFSGLTGWLMSKNQDIVYCVFVGFIMGTIPGLWKSAGEQGRNRKSYVSFFIGFLFLSALLILFAAKKDNEPTNIALFIHELIFTENDLFAEALQVNPDFWGFLLSGFLFALGFVVPGLGSSTFIIFIGLYDKMCDGIYAILSLDFSVVLPLAIGAGICLILLPKIVKIAYDKWYSAMSHATIGIVISSMFLIIPATVFTSTKNIIAGIFSILCGFIVAFVCDKISDNLKEKYGV